MLTKTSVVFFIAAAVVFSLPTSAAASTDDFFTPRSGGSNPGVDFGLTRPGKPETPPPSGSIGGSSGDSGSSGSGGGTGGSGSQTSSGPSICEGNIGSSSGGGDLLARLEACTADPAAPAAAAPVVDDAPPDAGTLAQEAANQLQLVTPQLKTSPAAPVKALVGLQTWLWVPDGQWRTLRESAEAGDTEVTVTAQPVQTRWDMGESTVNCAGPGREWRKGLGQRAQTSCGYTYARTSAKEPDQKYEISAVLRYRITWTCEGECTEPGGDLGTLDSAPAGAALQVSERQSVVIR